MFDAKSAQEMAKQFFDSLPAGVKTMNNEVENRLRQFLQQQFKKLELVTREEFDIQTQVLLKTRAKVEQLEAILIALEAQNQIPTQNI